MKRLLSVSKFALVLSLTAATVAWAEKPGEPIYDTDRDEWLADTDADGVADLTEELEGTDPYDAEDYLGKVDDPLAQANALQSGAQKVGFARGTCGSRFRQIGSDLCIDTDEQARRSYLSAQYVCRTRKARVCSQEDMYYVFLRGGSLVPSYNPIGFWLGDAVHDDTVLCGNKSVTSSGDPDRNNFEGHCAKNGSRQYFCCHDRQ
ncbi:MAG: hypothetical protein AAF725_13440 [Acidobacteriota bacterium]